MAKLPEKTPKLPEETRKTPKVSGENGKNSEYFRNFLALIDRLFFDP